MRVRVSYAVDVGVEYRKALRYRYGQKGKATREEVKQHFEQHGGTLDDDLMQAWHERADESASERREQEREP
jgi:DNA-binding PadR family transcriptional regulator